MNSISTPLNGKGLLGLLIACLCTQTSFADVAGRVSFVSGNVEAIANDGSRRTLIKGELVNGGERLETNRGRVQIRFTDGSFISLQPNTVFGLDQYKFDKNKPDDGSLLFNFLRGGMRTVSGAIGKANRANYKVQTPVATIGIRGTSYAANQEPNGKLLLTVGNGIVNLENNFGSSNVNVGQTFQVETGQAPNPAPTGVSVAARASSPNSQENTDKQQVANTQQPDSEIGNQVNNDGTPLFQSFIQLTNGLPRLSSFGSLLNGSSGVKIYPNVLGQYSELSDDGQTVGNLLGLIGTELTDTNMAGKVLLDTRKVVGGLQFANVQQIGSLSFGEWTNGSASIIDPYLGTSQQLILSDKQFMPYIVGTTAEKALGNNMKMSYVLAGATPARAGLDVGSLTKLNIDLDLNLIPSITIDMAATVKNVNYTAKLNNHTILDISADKKFSGFILSGEDIGFYANSSTSSICANNKCAVNLSAFLSSNDLGVVYEITRSGMTTIGGVAALRGSETNITPNITNNLRVDSTLEGKYTALFKENLNLNLDTVSDLAAVFDSQSQGLLAAFHTQGSNDNLVAEDFYGALRAADAPAAQIKDIGHVGKVLSWGRWTNGRIATGNDEQGGSLLGANDNVHYLIGLPTAASAIPNIGSVSYQLVGGTASGVFGTMANNQLSTTFDTGKVNSGNLVVDFAAGSTALSLEINGFTKANGLQSLQLNGAGALLGNTKGLSFGELSVTANQGNLACTACTASAQGLFFGSVNPVNNSDQIAPTAAGLTYNVTGTVQGSQASSMNVNGTAAFANPTLPPQNNQGG